MVLLLLLLPFPRHSSNQWTTSFKTLVLTRHIPRPCSRIWDLNGKKTRSYLEPGPMRIQVGYGFRRRRCNNYNYNYSNKKISNSRPVTLNSNTKRSKISSMLTRNYSYLTFLWLYFCGYTCTSLTHLESKKKKKVEDMTFCTFCTFIVKSMKKYEKYKVNKGFS